jgi:pyroglutamyl-peptidase
MKTPTVLLTGFDPFDGDAINPAWEAVRALDGETIAGHRVVAAKLPVVFGDALHALREAITRTKPALVICVGVANTRTRISIERVAINVDDARIPDNAGRQPIDAAVVEAGPAAYFSTLPIKAMLHALDAAKIPVEISQTAGTYVCNHVFYGLMHELAAHEGICGGFIHVPPLADEGKSHGIALATLISGLRLAVEAALTHHRDLVLPAGATH